LPQRQRQQLVNEFQSKPDCRLFITTNVGSTGLNLQAANTVINCDLPWNPAVLGSGSGGLIAWARSSRFMRSW
jgi:SNF2 family DNA or RNA helicase